MDCQNTSCLSWSYKHNKIKIKIEDKGKSYNINKLFDSDGYICYKGRKVRKLNLKTEAFITSLNGQSVNPNLNLERSLRTKLIHKDAELKSTHLTNYLRLIEVQSGICSNSILGKKYEIVQILKCLEITRDEIKKNGIFFLASYNTTGLKSLAIALTSNCLTPIFANVNDKNVNGKQYNDVFIMNNQLVDSIEFIFLNYSTALEKLDSIDAAIEAFKQIQRLRNLNCQKNGYAIGSSIHNELISSNFGFNLNNFKPHLHMAQKNSLKYVNKLIDSILFRKVAAHNFLLGKDDPNSKVYDLPKDVLKYILYLANLANNKPL